MHVGAPHVKNFAESFALLRSGRERVCDDVMDALGRGDIAAALALRGRYAQLTAEMTALLMARLCNG